MADGYKKALDLLNDEQRSAVEQTDGPVLVIAGPGTGKTQLLATRIAYILKNTDTLPENILCLTFTESAVNTMRDRLVNLIGKAAYDVTISTYHSFGNDLIRRYPDYFEQYSDCRPIDELGIDNILRDILAGLPYSNPLKYSDIYLNDLRRLISDAKQAALEPKDLLGIAEHNEQYIKAANPAIKEVLKDLVKMNKSSMLLFSNLLKELSKIKLSNTGLNKKVLPLGKMLIESLGEAVEEAELIGKQVPLTAWKKDWLEKDSNNNFVIASLKVQAKLKAAAEIFEIYNQELSARKLYDYDDMILISLKVLSKETDLKYTLQERYLYILLDEFQDTNGAQFQLVEKLTDNPASENRPNVLAVGDDDQAIYAFQGADYSNMVQFNNMYTNVALVILTKNYRSTPDILHSAKGISSQIESRIENSLPKVNKLLTSESKALPGSTIKRYQAKSDVAQFGWVTRQIKELQSSGIAYKDIAVLAPQHKYLEPLCEYLTQEKIPQHYEKSENIIDDQQINELKTMSALVIALGNGNYELADSLWPEVLSYSFWNLETTLIWQLSWFAYDKKQGWTTTLLSDKNLRNIALFFIRLSMLVNNESLEIMMDYLIGTTPIDLKDKDTDELFQSPFYGHYFGQPLSSIGLANGDTDKADDQRKGTFWQLLTNLTVLRSRLRDYKIYEEQSLKLVDFIEFIDDHKAAKIKVLNTSPHQEATDAVQLMTAFKAKGQEFKVVFVLACIDEAWGTKARGAGNRLSLPTNLQFIRYGGATSDERLRLFYVSLTRAKSQLYLVSYSNTYSGNRVSPLNYLDESENAEGDLLSPLLPTQSQKVLQAVSLEDSPKTAELVSYWRQNHTKALDKRTAIALLRGRLSNYQLSPTDLGEFIDIEYSGPENFFLYKLLRFPSASTPEVCYGSAIHETLHWIHLHNKRNGSLPSVKQATSRLSVMLKSMRLNDRHYGQLMKRGRPVIKAYLDQRSSTISIDNECEYNFRNEGVFLGEAHMSGKIDKLIINRAKKTITIVDYKTGNSSTSWSHSTKMHKYTQQLYLYKFLVERSHSFRGYKVTDAYVEFVEPNEDGKITELHIKFNIDTEKEIEQLAIAVWNKIQELNLPDISGYKPDIKGIEQFEKDLLLETNKPTTDNTEDPLTLFN